MSYLKCTVNTAYRIFNPFRAFLCILALLFCSALDGQPIKVSGSRSNQGGCRPVPWWDELCVGLCSSPGSMLHIHILETVFESYSGWLISWGCVPNDNRLDFWPEQEGPELQGPKPDIATWWLILGGALTHCLYHARVRLPPKVKIVWLVRAHHTYSSAVQFRGLCTLSERCMLRPWYRCYWADTRTDIQPTWTRGYLTQAQLR